MIHGANNATKVRVAITKNPKTTSLFLRKSLLITNPGIHDRIDGIGEEIDQDVTQRNREDAALQQRVIACINRLNRQAAEPRPGEYRLGNDGSCQQRTRLKPEDRIGRASCRERV